MGCIGQNKLSFIGFLGQTMPVINFSKVVGKPGSPEWERVRDQVKEALAEYGCFEATFDDIPLKSKKALLGSMKELFNLPLEIKSRNISQKPYHGYVGQLPMLPLYESFGIEDPNVYDMVDSFSNIFWLEGNTEFSEMIQSFSEKLSVLDRIIRRMIVEGLGLEKYTEEHLNSTNYLLRLTKYKGPKTGDAKVGLPCHTDRNTLTILFQNEVEGLEVKTKDGDWIPYKPATPESFVVMVGDSLHVWTNGRLCSTQHRVMMRGKETRYSVSLSSTPKSGFMIKAPDEMVDENHPLLYKPLDYVAFLRFCSSEARRGSENPLKAFCGA